MKAEVFLNRTFSHRAQWPHHHFHPRISSYCHYWMPNKIYCCNDDFSSIAVPKCQPSILRVSIEAHVDRHHLPNTTQKQKQTKNKLWKINRGLIGVHRWCCMPLPETNRSPSLENSMALTQPKCATKFVRYKFLATANRSRNKFARKLCTLLPNWRPIKCDTAFESFNFARAIMKCGLVFCLIFYSLLLLMTLQCTNYVECPN